MNDQRGTPAAHRPVRVAHVMWRLTRFGGVQIVVRRLIREIDPADIDLHLVIARPTSWNDDLGDVNATLHSLDWEEGPLRPVQRLAIAWRSYRALRAIRPDVVQLHTGTPWLGILAVFLMPRVRFVMEVHDAPGSGRSGSTTDRIEGWMVRFGRAVAVCHTTQVAEAIRDEWHLPDKRIVMFPLGVDTARFTATDPERRRAWRADLGISEDAVVLLGVGRFAASKRFNLAIDALGRIRDRGVDAVLVLIGGAGESLDAMRAYAEEAGQAAHTILPGRHPNDELPVAYAASDIVISVSEYEGFGLTLIEGMASGLPVVAMSVGGVPDVVDDPSTGLLIGPDDLDGFIDAVVELAGDPARRAAMGVAGRERATTRFDAALCAQRFQKLYLELAGRAG